MNSVFLVNDEIHEEIDENPLRNQCKYDFYIPNYSSTPYSSLSSHECEIMLIKRFEKLLLSLQSLTSVITSSTHDNSIDIGDWTHFLSLTYPSIDVAIPSLSDLRQGIDAFELRVDLLENISSLSIIRQIALLRDFCPLPIVYTVRSIDQLGKFPLQPSQAIVKLLQLGLRANIEWLDVEACLSSLDIEFITRQTIETYQHRTRIIGSYHITSPISSHSSDYIESLFKSCNLNNQADLLKVVTGAATDEDCDLIHEIGTFMSSSLKKPYIGLCLGLVGSRSRVMNRQFTPVTHESMTIAAPGQLTVKELMSRRIEMNLIKQKSFYLFGKPISQSISPRMHNKAFETLLLPHQYSLFESDNVEDCYDAFFKHLNRTAEEIANIKFDGASVTIPHKETIIPYLHDMKGAASVMLAVNTIVVEQPLDNETNRRVGYNTDWIGMIRPIQRLLFRRQMTCDENDIGIVLGAGGTSRAACYAMNQLGQ